ncbi:MFS transporter [Nocardioides rubriscoriae]|uniref:MFS transporter n=1 Tax=Nocardioides rubriscoriae TaxID=642762 RepID=UPI0011DFB3CC|nr:MFS transporter [Nocardioides rubriscoriae]
MESEDVGSSAQPNPQRWRALFVLALVQFMLVLDNTVVNVALPSVQRDLGLSPTGLAWVVNAYVITFGGLLLLGGRVADGAGRRRTYLVGVLLFAVASGACGAAQDGGTLIASRFVQGLGAAAVAPAALSMVTLLFTDAAERARAFSIWGGLAALGGTTGVVLSGVLADLASWRWIFFVNLPVAAFCLVALPRLVAESRAPVRRRPDWAGAALATTSLVSLIYALLEAGLSGWGRAETAVPLVVSMVAGAGFMVVEASSREPLVPLRFLRHRTRATAYVAGLAVMAAFFATFFSVTLFLQDVLGFSPLRAGLAYVPYGVALVIGIAASSAATRRHGARSVLAPGLLVACAGLTVLSRLTADGSYVDDLLLGLVVLGLGNGLAIPAVTLAGLSDVRPAEVGLASGLQNTVLQVGGAVGLAALVSLGTAHARGLDAGGLSAAAAATAGFGWSFRIGAAVLLASAVAVVLGQRGRSSSRPPSPSVPSDHPSGSTTLGGS